MPIFRIIALLPFPALYTLSWLLYLALYYVARYRRPVVADNLRHAFPEMDNRQHRKLAKAFYRQLADVAFEIIKASRMPHAAFSQRVKVLNPEFIRQQSRDFQDTVIVLTIHQGNWEWMLHATSSALGVPMDPVYKPLHNAGVNKLMLAVRSRFGARPLALKSAARDIVKQRDRFRLLTLVADQSPTRREKSVWTGFLNREAAFTPGPEALARANNFPVVFARCRRERRGHYTLEFMPLAQPPYLNGEDSITLRYAQLTEQAIREEPESWLWSNRRWKRSRNQQEEKAGKAGDKKRA